MIKILRDQTQINSSRAALRDKGLDTSVGWRRAMYSLRFLIRFRRAPEPVALVKSWDVLTMHEAVTSHSPDRKTLVFEMGSYNSEIALVLWQSGYHNIRASDFNPIGRSIRWYGNSINFKKEDFYNPDLEPGSVGVMTALSVIEHGYDQAKLIATAKRLLAPGGLFLLTTDYREEGIQIPSEFRVFGLPYRIFSRADLESLVNEAASAGLELISTPEWGSSEYPIHWEGWQFTFAFLGFRKTR